MVETASPSRKPGWGAALPPALINSPAVACWRPWEGKGEEVDMGKTWQPWSAQNVKSRKKRKSPAAARRSRLRLQQWQEKRDQCRLHMESRICTTTPLKPSGGMVGTLLANRFQVEKGEEIGLPHSQSGNQLTGEGGKVVTGSPGKGEAWVCSGSASSSSNLSLLRQSSPLPVPHNWCTPVHPPTTPSSSSAFWQGAVTSPPLPLTLSGLAAPGGVWGMLPGIVTSCPSCRAWGLLTSS